MPVSDLPAYVYVCAVTTAGMRASRRAADIVRTGRRIGVPHV
jgi:hypothetical protein